MVCRLLKSFSPSQYFYFFFSSFFFRVIERLVVETGGKTRGTRERHTPALRSSLHIIPLSRLFHLVMTIRAESLPHLRTRASGAITRSHSSPSKSRGVSSAEGQNLGKIMHRHLLQIKNHKNYIQTFIVLFNIRLTPVSVVEK